MARISLGIAVVMLCSAVVSGASSSENGKSSNAIEKKLSKKISANYSDATLADVCADLTNKLDVKVTPGKGLDAQSKVTVSVQDMPGRQALIWISMMLGDGVKAVLASDGIKFELPTESANGPQYSGKVLDQQDEKAKAKDEQKKSSAKDRHK